MRAVKHPAVRGMIDSLSIAIGYFPVAISFGLAAISADIPPWAAVLTSVLVYAGASQFILITLVAGGSTAFSVIAIVLLMNLRHLFYGPALLGKLPSATRRFPSLVLAAGLTDEVFATSISRLEQQPIAEREGWYVGLQAGAYSAWVGGTAVGAFFGHGWMQGSPWLAQTLDFVLPALFLALLLELWSIVPGYVVVGAALATAAGLAVLPPYGAIIAGMGVGAALASRRGA
ncbi:MAG TPA: AzlC family ABC transporter permease [Candidimonas sp.]|nr:AzlC family ABC transporter permease [Candidimonas sp.]